jgi:hypothetical protein
MPTFMVEQCWSEVITYNICTYKHPFLYIDSCYALLWHSVVEWMRNLCVPENYGFDTIISRPFLPPHLQVLEVHINSIRSKTIHIIESKIHISYSGNHDSTLMLSSIIFTCHPFQPSLISLLKVILFQSVLLLMLLNHKKLSWGLIDWQLSAPSVNEHAYS